MRKLIIIFIVLTILPIVASAQVTGSLWKISSNSLFPVNSSWSLTLPYLAGNGTGCASVSNTGLLGFTSCGGSSASTTLLSDNNTFSGTNKFSKDLTINSITAGDGGGNVSSNTAFGHNGLATNSSGTNSAAFGYDTLELSTGSSNSGFGYSSLLNNAAGTSNTGFGIETLFSNSTGNGNVALGPYAGYRETGSNDFYVNNIQESSLANDKAYSLLYGTFSGSAGSTAGQQLTVNGLLQTPQASTTVGVTNSGSTWLTGLTASELLALDNNNMVISSSTIGANLLTGVLGVTHGGTGAATLTGCLTGNGTGSITGSGTCNTSNATVSSVAAGTGLNGGTITTTGTLSLKSYISTSSADTANQIPYWTTTNGTPAQLGANSALTFNPTGTLFTATNGSTTSLSIGSYMASPFYELPIYIASSTWGTGTTTVILLNNARGITIVDNKCNTSAGTLDIRLYHGTVNNLDFLQASTTNNTFLYSTNNVIAAGTTTYMDIGTAASSPTSLNCTLEYVYNQSN